ncbi:MAG: 50S ribosomal protein L30e [Candidatus Lokiarchaeota archaeon]|nr:50S ribosomal protein L30e [Candidatus Lokiarchaeota archaeon]
MARKNIKISDTIDLSRKKVKEFDIDTNIKVAYKTGKMIFGKTQVLRQLRQDPFKMIIIANNCPSELEAQVSYYNSLINKNIFIHKYKGSSWDLGLAMGKPYMISVIGINDFGDSDLMTLKAKNN